MRITIDSNVLEKYGLTIEDFILLYLSAKKINIQQSLESLVKRGIANWNLFSGTELILSDNIKELLSSVIIDSDKEVLGKEDSFLSLAEKLQEIYPKGKKAGTTYMWRGTKVEIAKKLKTLVVKYHYKFTEEQAITATRNYVASFNGDYTKMRLLKYFILKVERDADNNAVVVTDFMSLIENEGQENLTSSDWTDRVI